MHVHRKTSSSHDDDSSCPIYPRSPPLGPPPFRWYPQLFRRAYIVHCELSLVIYPHCFLLNSTNHLHHLQVSSYSFETHAKSAQIRILNIKDGSSQLVTDDPAASDPIWITETEVAFIKSGDNGTTILVSQDVSEKSSEYVFACPFTRVYRYQANKALPRPHMIHYFAGSIANPKAKRISDDEIIFCCSAPTTPSGDMYWPAAETKSHTSAKIYTGLFVRHWDTWSTPNNDSLWYGLIVRRDKKWTLDHPGLQNLLSGTKLSCPVAPFGGAGDFDITASGITFVSKDPGLNPARNTKTDLYYVPLDSWLDKAPAPQMVKTGRLRGYSLAPTFSRDGRKIAFARMRSQQYESDKTRLLLIPDVNDLSNVQEFYETKDGEGSWDFRPDWIVWGKDDKELYIAAEKHGRMLLWKLPSDPLEAKHHPQPIHQEGCVIEARPLGDSDSLLITSKSRIESSSYAVLDVNTKKTKVISSSAKNGRSFGLLPAQCSEIWYPGSAGYDNHALVMTPSNFSPTKKYPLAFLIHGGPQSAWTDDWSTRWNPAIFAEQGYVVVCPNPTGSTGYGQAHTDAIKGNWGGKPYEDLVKCFEYIEDEMKFVDTKRAVALGASYGGYMISKLLCFKHIG